MKTTVALLLIVWFVALCHGAGSAVAWVEGGNNNFPTKYNYLHRHSVLEDSNGDLWLFGGNGTANQISLLV